MALWSARPPASATNPPHQGAGIDLSRPVLQQPQHLLQSGLLARQTVATLSTGKRRQAPQSDEALSAPSRPSQHKRLRPLTEPVPTAPVTLSAPTQPGQPVEPDHSCWFEISYPEDHDPSAMAGGMVIDDAQVTCSGDSADESTARCIICGQCQPDAPTDEAHAGPSRRTAAAVQPMVTVPAPAAPESPESYTPYEPYIPSPRRTWDTYNGPAYCPEEPVESPVQHTPRAPCTPAVTCGTLRLRICINQLAHMPNLQLQLRLVEAAMDRVEQTDAAAAWYQRVHLSCPES